MLRPDGLTAVLFDLDGTLRHNCPSSTVTFLDYAVELGVPDSAEMRREAARWTHYYWASSPELRLDLKAYPEEGTFWLNFTRRNLQACGCAEELAEQLAPRLHALMEANHKPQDCVPADVPPTLQRLQQAGFRLAVLSNRTEPCNILLDELGLSRYMDLSLVAGELHAWKPDPQIFLRAVARMDLRPEQAVYVGDNYYADVIGAERAGLLPVLIDPDHLFPEATCRVIRTMGELAEVLEEQALSKT